MLKYSFMTFACPDYTLDQALKTAAEHGYDGIEPRVASKHNHGIELDRTQEQRAEIKKKFIDSGVALGCLATSISFHRETAQERAAVVDEARRYIDLCADCGGKRMRVFGGGLKQGFTTDQAAGHSAEGLTKLAEHAQARDVMLCLETHDSHSLGATVAGIVDSINHPFIRSTWDVQHPVSRGETIEVSEKLLRHTVQHIHMHDIVPQGEGDKYSKIVPIGEGVLPLADILRFFREIDFKGCVSGEWWPNPGGVEETIPHYIKALKELEAGL